MINNTVVKRLSNIRFNYHDNITTADIVGKEMLGERFENYCNKTTRNMGWCTLF